MASAATVMGSRIERPVAQTTHGANQQYGGNVEGLQAMSRETGGGGAGGG